MNSGANSGIRESGIPVRFSTFCEEKSACDSVRALRGGAGPRRCLRWRDGSSRGVRRGRRLRQSSSYWTESRKRIGRRLIEAALAYDAACVQHNVKHYRNFVVPVVTQSEKAMASLPLCCCSQNNRHPHVHSPVTHLQKRQHPARLAEKDHAGETDDERRECC